MREKGREMKKEGREEERRKEKTGRKEGRRKEEGRPVKEEPESRMARAGCLTFQLD